MHHHQFAKDEFRSKEKVQQFTQLLGTHEPSGQDIIEFMDGVSFMSECTSENIQQMHSTLGMIVIPW